MLLFISVFSGCCHCVKNVCIRSFSGPYFPAFGMNTERYGLSIRIQSKCGKIRATKTPNKDIFYAVCIILEMVDKALPSKHSYLFRFKFKIRFNFFLMIIRKKLKALKVKRKERKANQSSNIPVV